MARDIDDVVGAPHDEDIAVGVDEAGIRTAATVAAVKSYHMTPQVVGDLARRSGAGALAITHIVPPGADTALLAEEIRASGYAGPLIIGEDLMRLDWPQRLLRWNGATIGF